MVFEQLIVMLHIIFKKRNFVFHEITFSFDDSGKSTFFDEVRFESRES